MKPLLNPRVAGLPSPCEGGRAGEGRGAGGEGSGGGARLYGVFVSP